jgi:hypothetical protein
VVIQGLLAGNLAGLSTSQKFTMAGAAATKRRIGGLLCLWFRVGSCG